MIYYPITALKQFEFATQAKNQPLTRTGERHLTILKFLLNVHAINEKKWSN